MFTGEVRAPGAPPRTLRPRRRPAHATIATHPPHTRNHLYSYIHGEQRGVVPAQLEAAPACKPPTMRCLKWRCFFCPRDFSIRGRCAQGRGRRWSEERCVEAPSSQRPKPRGGGGSARDSGLGRPQTKAGQLTPDATGYRESGVVLKLRLRTAAADARRTRTDYPSDGGSYAGRSGPPLADRVCQVSGLEQMLHRVQALSGAEA